MLLGTALRCFLAARSLSAMSAPEPGSEPRREEDSSPGESTDRLLPELRAVAGALRAARSPEQQRQCLAEMQSLVDGAWALPGLGRDLASALCEQLRLERVLELLLQLVHGPELLSRYPAASLLEQVLIPGN
eukprot:g15129.t1